MVMYMPGSSLHQFLFYCFNYNITYYLDVKLLVYIPIIKVRYFFGELEFITAIFKTVPARHIATELWWPRGAPDGGLIVTAQIILITFIVQIEYKCK